MMAGTLAGSAWRMNLSCATTRIVNNIRKDRQYQGLHAPLHKESPIELRIPVWMSFQVCESIQGWPSFISVASPHTECSDINMNFSSPTGHLSLPTEWFIGVSHKSARRTPVPAFIIQHLSARSLSRLRHQRTKLQFDALLPLMDRNMQLETGVRLVT